MSNTVRLSSTILVLTALILRAVIPSGFMLEASAAARGELKLVICTGSGSKIVDTGAADRSSDHDEDGRGSQHEPCAFAAGATALLPPLMIGTGSPDISAVPAPVTLAAFVLPPIRAGPTLGSRAPPRHS